MEKEEDLNKNKQDLDNMGLFGRGKGFLGLSKKKNILITIISTILGVIGVFYFVFIGQYLSALGIIGVYILILIETYR